MPTARSISSQTVFKLEKGWRVTVTSPGVCASPAELDFHTPQTENAQSPGTIVSALKKSGSKLLEGRSPDDFDVWYRCSLNANAPGAGRQAHLVFEGLATVADVWLDGEHILRSENMYLRHEIDVTAALNGKADAYLVIRFSSLNKFLEQRRLRPRWRTKLVDHQQLRWVRTTLIGRMPGWHAQANAIHAVGPWRPISLVYDRVIRLEKTDLKTSVDAKNGYVAAHFEIVSLLGEMKSAHLSVGENSAELSLSRNEGGRWTAKGTVTVPDPELWWPHTHGAQPLYRVRATVIVGEQTVEIDLGRTGFRGIAVDRERGDFAVSFNGQSAFLRGACWTSADTDDLAAGREAYRHILTLTRDAGMNMIRIPGNAFYEADDFYDLCDELGIAVWQDFAFGIMDYPVDDPAFDAACVDEAKQFLSRTQLSPALAILCGNSECEATAAMHGLTEDQSENPIFSRIFPDLSAGMRPDLPYVPSSQWGGALPFHVDCGVSHYYGVGAYLRPLDDLRRSSVRFATECLGFGNVPEDAAIDAFLADGESPGHHPSWNAGSPRNVGQGWDFGDVCAYYTRLLMGEDLNAAMYSDRERYLALARVIHGELMDAAFTEWRRPGSSCRGAIIWWLRDLWPSPGWGIIDSFDAPKSVYYYLKRICSPRALFFVDEGLSGLRLNFVNEPADDIYGRLRIAVYRHGEAKVEEQFVDVHCAGRNSLEVSVDAAFGRFIDPTYAYRYGAPLNDVIYAEVESAGRATARAFYFPNGIRFARHTDLGLQAESRRIGDGEYEVTVRSARFAQAVSIDARGYAPSDNYFHVEPGGERAVVLTAASSRQKPLSGSVFALNAFTSVRISAAREERSLETSKV